MRWLFLLMISPLLASAAEFNDTDFSQAVNATKAKNARLVIYAWSPNMVLSMKGLNELLQRPWIAGTQIIVLCDPDSDEKLAQKTAKDMKWPVAVLRRATAPSLIKKGLRVHYPSYTFARGGKVTALVPGYKSPRELDRLIKRYL